MDSLGEAGTRAALRYDSEGVWIVGGVRTVNTLSVDSQCVAGALHHLLGVYWRSPQGLQSGLPVDFPGLAEEAIDSGVSPRLRGSP